MSDTIELPLFEPPALSVREQAFIGRPFPAPETPELDAAVAEYLLAARAEHPSRLRLRSRRLRLFGRTRTEHP